MKSNLRLQLEDDAKALNVKITDKSHLLWGLLAFLLKPINPDFRTGYITTLGAWIATPDGEISDATLAHELVHVRQFKKMGLGSTKLGVLPMFFVYLLFPLPAGLALGRWWLESPAYLTSINTSLGLIRTDTRFRQTSSKYLINDAVEQLTGPAYGYTMWFAKGYVRRWFEKRVIK